MAKYTRNEIYQWFTGKMREAAGAKKQMQQDITSNAPLRRSSTVLGRMYFFSYDPKHKATLPIYDKFPLVFPIESYNDGFLGLNLHYLNQGERQIFLNRLSAYLTDQRYDENTRLRMSYSLLESTKGLASLGKPCVHRYLYNHVRSKFVEVTSNEWDKAIELPVELFVTKK